jgi:NADPH:quinone reductase-like Zn-dependent oxidoreductase
VAASLGQTLRARGPVVAGPAAERPEVAAELVGLVDAGRLRVVIDRTVDLGDVAEAHRLVDGGRKVGNVLVHP